MLHANLKYHIKKLLHSISEKKAAIFNIPDSVYIVGN